MCMCIPSLKLTSHGNVAFSFANLTFHGHVTVPKTNIAPENRPAPKRKQSSNHHFFKCKLLVSGRVCTWATPWGNDDHILRIILYWRSLVGVLHIMLNNSHGNKNTVYNDHQ